MRIMRGRGEIIHSVSFRTGHTWSDKKVEDDLEVKYDGKKKKYYYEEQRWT